jgi:hypothetical protein
MKPVRAFLICILVAITSRAAFAQSVWTCTWPGYGNGGKPVIGRFRVVGNDVVDDEWQLHYKILQNNTYGLVAAWSISEIEPNRRYPSVGTFLIVIDKQTNVLKTSAVAIGEQNYAPSVGTCIPN